MPCSKLYNTALHSTALQIIALFCTALHCTAWHCMANIIKVDFPVQSKLLISKFCAVCKNTQKSHIKVVQTCKKNCKKGRNALLF